MWSSGENWKLALDYVKSRRKVCNPNVAFSCNLIEINEILHGNAAKATLLFRCAFHSLYDHTTPVLKLCRNNETRRILFPATSLLSPRGVYIIRGVKDQSKHEIFLWIGLKTSQSTVEIAEKLAKKMIGVFSNASSIIKVRNITMLCSVILSLEIYIDRYKKAVKHPISSPSF